MSTSSIASTLANQVQSTSSTGKSASSTDPFSNVNVNDFLKLMITQLQNQDPTKPTDNAQIMQQLGEMQQIQSTINLNQTLQALAMGQNLSSAGSLISKTIQGLDDKGNSVNGTVTSVQIQNGTPQLVVGSSTVSLSNVQSIQ
jgi:flagellar basal-body rod modification protein FlgD